MRSIREILIRPFLKLLKTDKSTIITYICLAIIVGIYAYIEIINFTSAYLEVDPDGYLWLAKRIAEFKPLAVKDDDPFMYQSHVWVENKDGEITPKFAPGYPAIMAIAYRIAGDTAMFAISPIMGGLALIGSFLLFRMWMSKVSALFGVFLLAINYMLVFYCSYLLTHASDLCFTVWGMFFLWRWKRGIGKYSSIFAGLFLGYAVTIRHASLLLVTVLITAIILRWIDIIKHKSSIKQQIISTTILLACYIIFPLLLAIYNWTIFDSPFVTGYGLSGEQLAFNWKNISNNMRILSNGFYNTALYFIYPIGFAGMFLMGTLGESIMVLLWVIPLFLLYASYYWAPNGMAYFRFLIATFSAFSGSAFALMDRASKSWLRKAITYFLMSGLIIFMSYYDLKSAFDGTMLSYQSKGLAYLSRQVSKVLNDDAVIFSRSPAFCYIGTRRHFRHYDLNIFTSSYGANSFKEDTEPRRHPVRNDRLREFYAKLTDADLQKKKAELISNFIAEGRQVSFLLQQSIVKNEQDALGKDFRWNKLADWIAYTKNDGGVWQGETWELYELGRNR